jgi:hypothetical protein
MAESTSAMRGSANKDMQLTERGLLVGAPADDDRCRPAIFIESRSAADLRCSTTQEAVPVSEDHFASENRALGAGEEMRPRRRRSCCRTTSGRRQPRAFRTGLRAAASSQGLGTVSCGVAGVKASIGRIGGNGCGVRGMRSCPRCAPRARSTRAGIASARSRSDTATRALPYCPTGGGGELLPLQKRVHGARLPISGGYTTRERSFPERCRTRRCS